MTQGDESTPMDEFPPTDDEALLERLRSVLPAAEPVPAHVREAARAAFAWRTIDADLAELVRDTAGEETLAGARGQATARLLTFVLDDVEVELEIDEAPPHRLAGQLVGASARRLLVERPDDSFEVDVDALGRFEARDLAPGPCRLRWSDGRSSTVTHWFVI
jgi:hypothetical protein